MKRRTATLAVAIAATTLACAQAPAEQTLKLRTEPNPSQVISPWRINDAHLVVQRVQWLTYAASLPAPEPPATPRVAKARKLEVPTTKAEDSVGAAALDSGDYAEREARWSNPANWTANWDGVADCESGGDWSTNTGNGYYGGLQEDLPFWRTYGDTDNWSRPDLAPKWAQIEAAEKAKRTRGLRPWTCGYRG